MADLTPAQQAVALLRDGGCAVCATIQEDQPYVSSTPLVLNKAGEPVVFISDLARHTKNIKKNPKASVVVNKPDKEGGYFNGSRVTVGGKFVQVTDEKEIAECRKLYMDKYPEAEEWADLGDFNYYKLDFNDVYFIGGFGEIHKINLDDYREAAK